MSRSTGVDCNQGEKFFQDCSGLLDLVNQDGAVHISCNIRILSGRSSQVRRLAAHRRPSPVKDPLPILVIAYSVRRLPYVVRSAAAGFQQTSLTLEEAAQNLGCPPLRTLMKITVRLIMANLLAGTPLAFFICHA